MRLRNKSNGINTSGLQPIEFKVIVLQDEVATITPGGIYVPEKVHDREQQAETTGTLLATGGLAFSDSTGPWAEPVPQVGDKVLVAKYAGYFFTGYDGREYQCCQDKDIAGIWIRQEQESKKEKANARVSGRKRK